MLSEALYFRIKEIEQLAPRSEYQIITDTLKTLNVPLIEFDDSFDFTAGYCQVNGVAFNPKTIAGTLDANLSRVAFHECAHYLLRHNNIIDNAKDKDHRWHLYRVNEVEAETIAQYILKTLKFPDKVVEESQKYLNYWTIPDCKLEQERHQRLIETANIIMKGYIDA